jgi:hypothetical protein
MGGDRCFVGQGYLALYSGSILGKSGSGGVRDSRSHRGRGRGTKHEDIRCASDTPSVGSINGKLDFTEDCAVRRRREGD